MRTATTTRPKRTALLFLIVCVIMLSSCNSARQTTDYPNFSSQNLSKPGNWLVVRHDTPKIAIKKPAAIKPRAIEINESGNAEQVYKPVSTGRMHSRAYKSLAIRGSILNFSKKHEGMLTASLSAGPLLIQHSINPVTNKASALTAPDTTKNKVTQAPAASGNNDEQTNLVKQKRLKAFAIVSLVAGLLSIVTLAFLPGVFLLLAIAAIVFGALGLKSAVKKFRAIAIAGLVIGVVMIALFLIALIAFFASGGLWM